MNAGHEWTDEEIEKLSRAFAREYRQAEREMRQKLSTLMADYNEKNNDWLRKLADGTAEREDYEAWLHKMATDKAFMGGLADTLARDAMDADKRAMELINDAVPTVYAENANRAAYEIDSTLGRDHSFDLYDQSTVRRLLTEPENAMRIPQPSIDGSKDLRWNKQKFTSAITQSVLQGESVPNAAKRLANVLGMDSRALMMSARTALTGAENAGRVDSYRRAEALGIRLEQQWMATLDERTRESHRELDGQHVPVGEKFEVDGEEIEFPGDPSAPPELVCNCRCTLVAWFPNTEQKDPERWSRLADGMTYEQWKRGKQVEDNGFRVVDGKNIVGTWKRRQDQFDFVIDDVVNAQGFDGKPRVVSAEEFDRAVKEANDGNGFVAQRTYSAPDQETLDSYRQQLYGGKWYVDCSRGGSAYGCGMYTVSDYSGTITGGMEKEIGVYSRGNYSYIETVTLDPSARVISYDEIASAKSDIRDEIINRYTMSYIDAHADVLGEEGVEFAMRQNRLAGYEFDYARMGELYDNMSDDARRIANNAMLDAAEAASEELRVFSSMDVGSFAAMNGYDAIVADGRGASGSYTVILNRTKLIIKEPK